jgi:hypothetical protein
MKKTIISLFFVFVSLSFFSQNQSYRICDTIFDLVNNGNYQKGIKLWNKTNEDHMIDPRNKMLFLVYTWENRDTINFKNTLKSLIEDNGLEIEDYKGWIFFTDFTNNKPFMALYKFYYDMYHKNFLNKNSDILYTIQKINDFRDVDQEICIGQINKFKMNNQNDSILNNKLDLLAEQISMETFLQLVEISKKNNCLPNSFDQKHPHITGIVNLILVHNTKISYKVSEKWNMIWPYMEKACLEGKYDAYDLLWIYDNSMYWNYGYQYYGMLLPQNVGHNNKIPIKDERMVNERRAKYGVLPLSK